MKARREVVLLLLTAGLALVGCGGDAKPISEQSCRELVATFKDIQRRLAADPDFNTKSQEDTDELNSRVDALGGCPNEPSLQEG